MIRVLIGMAISAIALYGSFYYGGEYERNQCELRVQTAISNFEKLQTKVSGLVDEFATDAEKQLADEEKTSADKLKMVLERQRMAAGQKCTVGPALAASDRELRRETKGSVPGSKR